MVLLSKMEETVIVNGHRFELSCNRYPGVIHPEGHLRLKQFRRDPFPVFVYDVDGAELEKTVFMVHGENTTVMEYEWKGLSDCILEVRPMLAFRDCAAWPHPTVNTAAVTKATRSAGTRRTIRALWPWLMGPFLPAYLKVNGRSAKARRQADQWLSELRRFIRDEGLGQVPEVFDGD